MDTHSTDAIDIAFPSRRGHVGRKQEMEARKIVSLQPWLIQAIQDYRFEARISTESEAIRQLIIKGLAAEGRPVEPPAKPT